MKLTSAHIIAFVMSLSPYLVPYLLDHLGEKGTYYLGFACVLLFHLSGQVLQMMNPSIKKQAEKDSGGTQ